jgi:hypothetical protein
LANNPRQSGAHVLRLVNADAAGTVCDRLPNSATEGVDDPASYDARQLEQVADKLLVGGCRSPPDGKWC